MTEDRPAFLALTLERVLGRHHGLSGASPCPPTEPDLAYDYWAAYIAGGLLRELAERNG